MENCLWSQFLAVEVLFITKAHNYQRWSKGGEDTAVEPSQHRLCIRTGTVRRQHQEPEGEEEVAPGGIKSLGSEQPGD